MPELPEVETVRRGLAPRLTGATITGVRTRRANLRFPFPSDMEALVGGRIVEVGRRSKYLIIGMEDGSSLLSHLGMTGRFGFSTAPLEAEAWEKHDHLLLGLRQADGTRSTLVYNDARRFGFVDLVRPGDVSRFVQGLGPEPLSNSFDAVALGGALAGRRTSIKAALMDQRVVAGLGNIYVCEALFAAGISPLSIASDLDGPSIERLTVAIPGILGRSIEAGGSTLKDYRQADGSRGSFQERFDVYGRTGLACRRDGCSGTIERIVQAGRSTFHCPICQTA